MKFKLTHSEFMAVYDVLKQITALPMPKHWEYKLIQTVLVGIWQKFYAKAYVKKKVYGLTLKPHEAIAFYMFMHNLQLGTTNHTGNVLRTMCNSIHQQFS